MKPSWGTKRNCPSCNAHFYDLNKTPAICPKCKHSFDPAAVTRGKRKTTKREAPAEKKVEIPATILATKKGGAGKKKDKKQIEAEGAGEGMGDIAEIEDVDDIESLQELSELEEMEEKPVSGDDADDESIIEELGTGEKALVGNVEEEEAKALDGELEDEQDSSSRKKAKIKKKKSK